MAAHNGHHQHHQLPSALTYPDEFSRVAHHRNEHAKRSKLKVLPASKEEHRAIKEAFNFEEDDNEDIAYLNFPLIWPVGIVSALSMGFFLFAFSAMELNDHLGEAPIEQLAGAVRLVCCILFTWTASQVFQTHQRFIHHTGCHGYGRNENSKIKKRFS
uniref:Transmembrane protein n=1 Tax=Globodera pallida TaxID=36090 RepID=A0A183C897_GLOPA